MTQRNELFVAALLGAALLVGGCKEQATSSKSPAKQPHAHPTEGPHGGALIEWGDEEYHLEFTVDHAKKEATVYVLDGEVKKAAPIKAESLTLVVKNVTPPATITLKAAPEKDDPAGSSSRFAGTHDALGKVMEFQGEVSGKVGDTPYSGEFKEKAHKH